MKLYQVAILIHDRNKNGDIVSTDLYEDEIFYIIAKDMETARAMVWRDTVPDDEDIEDVEVLVRPF